MKKLSLGFLCLVIVSPFAVQAQSLDLIQQAKGFVKELVELGKISKNSQMLDTSPEGQKLVQSLSSSVDFESLARVSLGKKWDSLKPPVRNDFMKTLQESIETLLYPRAHRISAPLNEIQFTKNSKKLQNVVAKTRFESEREGEIIQRDLEFELIFAKNGKKIIDAIIEGELVSANLKRQFDQALQKKTLEQILEQMKTRLKKARTPKTPSPSASDEESES